MASLLLYLLAAVGAVILSLVAKSYWKGRQQAALAKKWGCQPVPFDVFSDQFGILNVLRLMRADKEKRFPDHLQERFEKNSAHYGRVVSTVAMRVLGNDAIITCDPKNIQAMLATQFKDFGLGPNRASNFFPLLGHGIFSVDGNRWENSRALLRPQFVREQVSDLDLEERHVQNLMRALEVNADGWTALTNLQPLFFRLTLDSATEFLFGESVDTQLAALPGANASHIHGGVSESEFARAFDESQDWMAFAARMGAFHKLGHTKKFYQTVDKVHNFIDYYVQLAVRHDAKDKAAEEGRKEKYTFLGALAQETKDPFELRGQLLSILLAGRDSTSSLLGWCFWLLGKNPQYYQKLRTAIINDFGDYESCELTDITFSRLKSCTFLQHFMNETLRLFPLVSLNARTAIVRDTTLPFGGGPDGTAPIFIPKGMEVQYTPHVMQHRKDLWGPDAEEFRPERWEGRKTSWEYLPFNGGPRICIGQQFALTEAGYVLVRLLQRFDEMDSSEVAKMDLKHGLTLVNTPYEGVPVRFHGAGQKS